MGENNNNLTESDFLKVLWNYFTIHANQRIQMLNFYIILETFFITGLLALLQIKDRLSIVEIILGIAIVFFSYIFYALDKRTKDMIKISEEAIKSIEQKYTPQYGNAIMIFSLEQEKTLFDRRWRWFAKNCLSYSKLFVLIYVFFSIIGLVGIILGLTNMSIK